MACWQYRHLGKSRSSSKTPLCSARRILPTFAHQHEIDGFPQRQLDRRLAGRRRRSRGAIRPASGSSPSGEAMTAAASVSERCSSNPDRSTWSCGFREPPPCLISQRGPARGRTSGIDSNASSAASSSGSRCGSIEPPQSSRTDERSHRKLPLVRRCDRYSPSRPKMPALPV